MFDTDDSGEISFRWVQLAAVLGTSIVECGANCWSSNGPVLADQRHPSESLHFVSTGPPGVWASIAHWHTMQAPCSKAEIQWCSRTAPASVHTLMVVLVSIWSAIRQGVHACNRDLLHLRRPVIDQVRLDVLSFIAAPGATDAVANCTEEPRGHSKGCSYAICPLCPTR